MPTKKILDYNCKRTLVSVPDFDFEDVLSIKKKAGSIYTVNDVFTACWAGGLRRYLEKMEDPIMKTPEKILIRGQAPVGLPRPTKEGKVCCKMIFVVFRFPVGAATVRERLRLVHDEFSAMKKSVKVPLISLFGTTALKLGLDKLIIDTNNQLFHKTSFIFSNVPGPREPIKMYGKQIVAFRPFYSNVIHQVIFFTYAGKVSLSMVLDNQNIEKPDLFAICFIEELEAMKNEFRK